MSQVPQQLKYRASHEWIRKENDGSYTVGITEHAQDLLGDMVFVELPVSGLAVTTGQECAVVESVKAASDIYAPLQGEILTINTQLADSPELVNQDPYGQGWLFTISAGDEEGYQQLLDDKAYQALIDS